MSLVDARAKIVAWRQNDNPCRQAKETPLIPNDSRQPVTARELALLVGVSQSAVSRAYTAGASISPSMRTRILDAAEKLGYSPNAIASILSKRKSNIVGLLVSDFRNPHYPVMIDRLSRALQQAGQQCLLFNISTGTDIRKQLAAIKQYNIDAVIVLVSAAILPADALATATAGRAAVLINRTAPESDFISVCYDNAAGARALADHFYDLGHRRAAFVGGASGSDTNRERRDAFVGRLAELGMTLTGVIEAGEFSYQAGYAAASKLAALSRTDAALFGGDIVALGGMDALRDQFGIVVPRDLSIASFNDIEMAGWSRYNLTTFRYPIDMLIDQAIRMLSEPSGTRRVYRFPGELVVRQSTRPAT